MNQKSKTILHVPIVLSPEGGRKLEFTRINEPGYPHTWSKDSPILLSHVKVNVFIGGEFSVVAGSERFSPLYGDVCVLPPETLHYGQIPQPTVTDYYQLDMGLSVFDALPEGNLLLLPLLSCRDRHFFRPSDDQRRLLMERLQALEDAVLSQERALAFALAAQAAHSLGQIVRSGAQASSARLSLKVRQAMEKMEREFDTGVTAAEAAQSLGVSPSYLSRLFKKELGIGVHQYLMHYRILQAARLLKDHSVTEAAYLCGFSDSSHLISAFQKSFHCTPAAYQKRQYR